MSELTLEDIRKALDLINLEKLPLRRVEILGGWVEINKFGDPEVIGLYKPIDMALFNNICNHSKLKGKIGELYGVPIYITGENNE